MPPHHRCFTASALPPALIPPPEPSADSSNPHSPPVELQSLVDSSQPATLVPGPSRLPHDINIEAQTDAAGPSNASLRSAHSDSDRPPARLSTRSASPRQLSNPSREGVERIAFDDSPPGPSLRTSAIEPVEPTQALPRPPSSQSGLFHSTTTSATATPARVSSPVERSRSRASRGSSRARDARPRGSPTRARAQADGPPKRALRSDVQGGVDLLQGMRKEGESSESAPLSLASLLPALVSLLTCATCQRVLRNPTTLPCGHAVCLACADQPRAYTGPPARAGVHSRDERHHRTGSLPTISSAPQPGPIRSASGGLLGGWLSFGHQTASVSNASASGEAAMLPTPASSSPSSPTTPFSSAGKAKPSLKKNHCGRPGCKTWEKPRKELKGDYITQRVLSLLRNACPALDEVDGPVEEVGPDGESSIASVGMTALFSQESAALSVSSFDSGGGGEDARPEAEGKRIHRARSFQPEKRSRQQSLASSDSGLPELQVEKGASEQVLDRAEWHSALECAVCFQLLAEPATTPCAHTFCSGCLLRTHDHTASCPLCRAHLSLGGGWSNKTLEGVVDLVFEGEVRERRDAMEREADEEGYPIFVCTLSWPALPTFIHIFEPRYRLMLRRVLDSPSRSFGMVLPSRDPSSTMGTAHPFGTMLRVESCRTLEDGRSIVETIGTWRFRLLDRRTVDGYAVGRVERIEDVSPQVEADLERTAVRQGRMALEDKDRSTEELCKVCREFVASLRKESAPWVVQRLNNTIGPMPTDPGTFSFWMAEVMPVDDYTKATLLGITSPRERLRLVVFWIDQFKSSWWFTKGCSLM